jgi:hypothetical protein
METELRDHVWTIKELVGFVGTETRLTGALAKNEWTLYPFFGLLILIFFLLLPRACRYP